MNIQIKVMCAEVRFKLLPSQPTNIRPNKPKLRNGIKLVELSTQLLQLT